jgi:hypothetical protein
VIVGILVVVVGAAALVLLGGLNSLVKAAVQKYGSAATQTQVRLDAADVSLTSGKGTLRGLTIDNPKGYTTPHAFQLGEISVKIDVKSLTSDTVVIDEIVIQAPSVHYEVGLGGTNLGTIQGNVNAYGGGAAKAEPETGGTRFLIKDLWVRDGRVQAAVSATVPTKLGGRDLTAPLPEIHLANIGSGKGGATGAEIAAQVLDALLDAAMKAAARLALEDPEGLGRRAKDALDGILKGK